VKSEIISRPLLILVGPTAIGKTALSLRLAKRYDGEIVSVDSMQVYRHMDIGTAKASLEERCAVPHHLIDIVDPDENYDAARFCVDSLQAIRDIHSRNRLPILTGGTGLYLQSLLQGIFTCAPVDVKIRSELQLRLQTVGLAGLYQELRLIDKGSADKIQANDRQRILRALEIFYSTGIPWSVHLEEQKEQVPSIRFTKILRTGLTDDRQNLYRRINTRCEMMISEGLENETRSLLARGYDKSLKPFSAIGYRHMIEYIDGNWSAEKMVELLARDTRRYAKRQYTWFSRMEELHWFDVSSQAGVLDLIDKWLDLNHGEFQ
jgi:tRNA dimethylallyltransferase